MSSESKLEITRPSIIKCTVDVSGGEGNISEQLDLIAAVIMESNNPIVIVFGDSQCRTTMLFTDIIIKKILVLNNKLEPQRKFIILANKVSIKKLGRLLASQVNIYCCSFDDNPLDRIF